MKFGWQPEASYANVSNHTLNCQQTIFFWIQINIWRFNVFNLSTLSRGWKMWTESSTTCWRRWKTRYSFPCLLVASHAYVQVLRNSLIVCSQSLDTSESICAIVSIISRFPCILLLSIYTCQSLKICSSILVLFYSFLHWAQPNEWSYLSFFQCLCRWVTRSR